MNKLDVLKHYFGYTSFRGGQETLIDAVLNGRDVLGIMPTGGGKSICYQIPALMLGGLTIVISPLISLMKDQVMALKNAGISAAFLNSTMTYDEVRQLYYNLREDVYKILYVAPERLETGGFTDLAMTLPISLVAVDEAHCISEWGNDFRPSYRGISGFVNSLPHRPSLAAFTATATQAVRDDIERKLSLRNPVRVVTGFDRSNLNFEVLQPRRKSQTLLELIYKRRNKSGIVYCATRKGVDKVHELLCENGYSVSKYHAGLSDEERRQSQEDFVYDRTSVLVATNAFGMEIDKSNVSYVIHYNMPKSLEAYYQEAGRAGRDGEAADCILMYSASDIRTARILMESTEPLGALTEEEKRALKHRDYERLDRMIDYCKTTKCLRGNILDYFGQEHGEKCGNCGNCRTTFNVRDITVEAQKILSCVKRIKDRLGYPVGTVLVGRVLLGSEDKRILTLGLDKITTYGIMKDIPRGELRDMMSYLEDAGYMYVDPVHGGASLTAKAGDVLFRGETLNMEFKETAVAEMSEKKKKPKKNSAVYYGDAPDMELFELLRDLRAEIAAGQNVPAYIVFTNATLTDMTAKKPQTIDEFLDVSGVGSIKAEQYGAIFIEAIRNYIDKSKS